MSETKPIQAPSDDAFQLRVDALESVWQRAIDASITGSTDAERSEYYRRFDAANAVIEGYGRLSRRYKRYQAPWVGGEFGLAIAALILVATVGLVFAQFELFAAALEFIETRSVFFLIIALAVGLGWARYAVEVEARRAAMDESTERYLSDWRTLDLSYALLHAFQHEDATWRDEPQEVNRIQGRQPEKRLIRAKLRFDLQVELLTTIRKQRDKKFYFYNSDQTIGLNLSAFDDLALEQMAKKDAE